MARFFPTKRLLTGTSWSCIALGALASGAGVVGCVLDLPELRELQGVGGFGGFPLPTAGSDAGGNNPGGSGGLGGQIGGSGGESGGSDSGCSSGEKLCGDTCQPAVADFGCGADSCDPCPQLENASVSCSASGQCILTECAEGFADCDGDATADADLSVSNGCEYSFGTLADPSPPMRAPLQTMSVDGILDDWAAIPAYPMREVCSEAGCGSDDFAPITAFATLPLRRDLDAYFRVAWDASFLYLVVEAADDDVYVDPGSRADQNCDPQKIADCEDSMTLFFDGFDERGAGSSYGQSGRRLFLGLSNNFNSKFTEPDSGQVGIQGQANGPGCYRIEAQVSWEYLVAQGNPPASQFPPAVGNTYGFDLSVNDWDTDTLLSPPEVRRQSHVFWVNPGADYRFLTQGFQSFELTDAVSAQQ